VGANGPWSFNAQGEEEEMSAQQPDLRDYLQATRTIAVLRAKNARLLERVNELQEALLKRAGYLSEPKRKPRP
jgi:hypothetical protein